MPKIVDIGAQRREIRQAARRVFTSRSATTTGLASVAAEAGVGRSSLYHYYPTRAALVRDLIRDVLVEEEAVFVAAVGRPGTPLERIERLVADLVRLFDEWAAVGGLLLELRSRDRQEFRPFFARVRALLAGVVREGQAALEITPTVDADAVAATLIGVVDGLLLQHFVDQRALGDLDALGTALVALVRRMLRP